MFCLNRRVSIGFARRCGNAQKQEGQKNGNRRSEMSADAAAHENLTAVRWRTFSVSRRAGFRVSFGGKISKGFVQAQAHFDEVSISRPVDR